MSDDLSLALSYLATFLGGAVAFAIARRKTANRVVAALWGAAAGLLAMLGSPLLIGQAAPTVRDDWFEVALMVWGIFAIGCGAIGAFLGRAPKLARLSKTKTDKLE